MREYSVCCAGGDGDHGSGGGGLTVQLLGALTSQECPPPSLGLSVNDISSNRSGAARHLSEEPFTLT